MHEGVLEPELHDVSHEERTVGDCTKHERPSSIEQFYMGATNYFERLASTDEKLQTEFFEILTKAARKDQTILDVGCGSGVVLNALADRCTSIAIGIDVSRKGITIASNHKRGDVNRHFLLATAYKLPFPDCVFDTVYSTEVLEHLEHSQTAIDEMLRVTKPGGKLLISTPSWVLGFGRDGFLWRTLRVLPNVLIREIKAASSTGNFLGTMTSPPILDDGMWSSKLDVRLSDIDAVEFISPMSLFRYLSQHGTILHQTTYGTLRNAWRKRGSGRVFYWLIGVLERTPVLRDLGPSILVEMEKRP